jgi:hypothetical protein
VARSPWQNGHVEPLIGSIRPECLAVGGFAQAPIPVCHSRVS